MPLSAFAGTWLGSVEDDSAVMHEVSITVDGSGNITEIVSDGVPQGVTGTIQKSTTGSGAFMAGVFGIVFSDGSEGGFIVDTNGTHLGFLDDAFNFGVFQKGAAALPAYASADIAGSWSGYGVTLNSNFDVSQSFASSAVVNSDANRTFSGSDIGGAFNGSFPIHTSLGRWQGSFNYPATGENGDASAFLSADKTFAATWGCSGFSFPEDCSFSVWTKN